MTYQNEPTLNANEEQLVIDLASDYSEQMVQGRDVSIEDYLSKLPNEASRLAFTTLANMSRFISTIETIQTDDVMAEQDTEISKPSSTNPW